MRGYCERPFIDYGQQGALLTYVLNRCCSTAKIFNRTVNTVFGKVGKIVTEKVAIRLIKPFAGGFSNSIPSNNSDLKSGNIEILFD